ncbi:MAG: acetolactate decarboxylase [Cocleimonas sp.]
MFKSQFFKVFMLTSLSVGILSTSAYAESINIESYGHYKKMIHKKNTDGVIGLKKAIPDKNSYAVGAIQKGTGEITVLNGKVYLDYGKDGIGNALNTIPEHEKAVLLAVTTVEKWQSIEISSPLSQEHLFKTILAKAKEQGLDIKKPFPFLLEGGFKELKIHVINGQNPKFGGHGSKEKMFHMAKATKTRQKATVVGFYSASTQGVYTHPNESWHLHAVIEEEKISAHIDDIHTGHSTTLKLPVVESYDNRISLGFTAKEKGEFLTEMRQMLTSIQGIMTGIGANNRELIIKSAKYSGNRMARATPDSIKNKTPLSFKKIGGPTHMKFEELAIRAEDDDMDALAELTGDLMKNCLACHATFKVD